MIYLIVKMLALLLISAGIGAWIGWLLRGARDRTAAEEAAAQDVFVAHAGGVVSGVVIRGIAGDRTQRETKGEQEATRSHGG